MIDVLRTELHAKNKVIAINTLEIPEMIYSLNRRNWTLIRI